jgi:hypothetical protein
VSVYDLEKEKEQTVNPDGQPLGQNMGDFEESFDGDSASYPDGQPSSSQQSPPISDEEEKLAKISSESAGTSKDFYSPTSSKQMGSRISGALKKIGKKKLIAGPVGIIAIIFLILFLMSLLKIPNYAANIAGYRLARTAMEYSRVSAAIDSEKIAADTLDDSTFKSAFYDKYRNLRSATWGKFDKYRPEVAYKNMGSSGKLDYVTETSKTKFGFSRTKIKFVVINGNYIEASNEKFGRFYSNYKERARFAGEIQANVDESLKGYNSVVRGKIASKIRADAGIKLKFWDNKGRDYRKLKSAEADRLQLEKTREQISRTPSAAAVTEEIATAAEDTQKAINNCIAEPKCAEHMAQTGELPAGTSEAINNSLKESVGKTVLGGLNVIYGIGVPACLIYDGSLVSAQSNIDAQGASTTAAFYAMASAGSQFEAGDTTPQAIDALSRKMGDGDSVPDSYARGETVDTSGEMSPQAGPLGSYTLANAFLPSWLAEAINTKAESACPVITDPKVAVIGALAIIAGKTVVAVFTAGTGPAAEQAAETTARLAITKAVSTVAKDIAKKTTEKIVTQAGRQEVKAGVSGFSKKFGRDFIGIESATIAAKLVVLSKAGAINDGGTGTGASFKNSADMGADFHNNEIQRQMFYGAPMTNEDTVASDMLAANFTNQQDSNLPAYQRYFALQNPRSLLSKFSYQLRGFKTNNKPLIYRVSAMLNPMKMLSNFGLGNKKVLAADGSLNTHYGIVQWGWTAQENSLRDTQEYSILDNADTLEKSAKIADIEAKYGECYTESMGALLTSGKIVRAENGDIIRDQGLCSPNNLGPNNREGFGDLVFRWRIDKAYNATLDQNLSIQNPGVSQ